MNTIQINIEDAIASLLASASGINIYKSNRISARLFPYVTIQAVLENQMLGSFTGVYALSVELNYSDSAVKATQEQFDQKYSDIFNILYNNTDTLKGKLQNEATGVLFYSANITSQSPSIKSANKSWQRGLKLAIVATPYTETYIPSLDFSIDQNSMYVPLT
ncbi:MAG: hypothetical protein EB127_04570 [Alphaproteobacteria bacterium]|nr:hypothetical protein [Alphaproteobacteria bacterium]